MSKMKAYVRYSNNKAVAGSLIVRSKPPKVGTWQEVPYDLCCLTTTTTTTCPVCPTPCLENWTFENFDGTTFRNGDPIPQVTNAAAWAALTTPAWCYYGNTSSNGQIYGKLYNWYAINDPRGLAPVGYRVPSTSDWETLFNCLGGLDLAGSEMKTTGNAVDNTGLWLDFNTDATNSSGFSALPAGVRFDNGTFVEINTTAWFWTSDEYSPTTGSLYAMSQFSPSIDIYLGYPKKFGASVRLIKDI